MVHRWSIFMLGVVGLYACSQHPSPTRDEALGAIRAVASTSLQSQCSHYEAEAIVDSVQIGQFNSTSKHWPVRAFIHGNCLVEDWREPFSIQKDYPVTEDGFGGWKVASE